jgi:formamidopyrimidine-DNA glycosylase
VDLLAESSQFPEEWLFKHRWGKGKRIKKKELPNGEKIVYITVGGRTSAVVPSVQKKTGPVAGDVKSEVDDDASPDEDEGDQKPNKKRAPGAKAATKKETPHIEAQTPTGPTKKAVVGRMTIRQIRRMTW